MSIIREQVFELEGVIHNAFNDDFTKAFRSRIDDILYESVNNLEYWAKNDFCANIASHAQRMAEDAITAILKGDDSEMRRYLQCTPGAYTGRDREHPIIHGKLFETGALELRKQVVDAHAELLKNERILDLESQLASVIKQYNKAEAERESMWQRLRPYEGQ